MRLRDYLATFGKQTARKSGMVFPGIGGYGNNDPDGYTRHGWMGGALPGSDTNWVREAGDPALNAVVFGCLRWIMDNLPEPMLQVVRRHRDGTEEPEPNHPLLKLLRQPNPNYDQDALFAGTACSYALCGNAYWKIERDQMGRPVQLWWIPHYQVTPRWPQDGSAFITDYLYRPGGIGQGILWPVDDVVHFQWGLDQYTAGRVGMNRVFPVLRSIASVNEGETYTAAILKHMGIAPHLFSPDDSSQSFTESDAAGLRKWWQARFTKDGRGKPAVSTRKLKIDKIGMSPEELALKDILNRPELRICAAFGIPPSVVFVGMDGSKGFDNGGQHNEARRAAYQDCLVPMTKRFAATITHRLLPAFDQSPASRVVFDFSGVDALAEDQDALHARAREDYQKGLMTRNEARAVLGLPPVEETPEPMEAQEPLEDDDA